MGLNRPDLVFESNVRKIVQDKFGYKWVMTQESALRFDGNNIERYTSGNIIEKYRLSGVDIWDAEEDSANNEMCVLSSYGYIDIFSTVTGGVKKRIPKPQVGESDWFMDIILTPKHIWLNGFNGVWIYDRTKEKFVKEVKYKPGIDNPVIVKRLFKDQDGNVWLFNKQGKITIYNDALEVINAGNQFLGDTVFVKNLQVNDMVAANGRKLYLATSKGVLCCTYSDYQHVIVTSNAFNSFFFNTPVGAICRSENSLYIATNTLYRVTLDTFSVLEYKDRYVISQSDWFSSVESLYADNAGLLWLGGRNGLSYFNIALKPFTSYYRNKQATFGLEHVFYVLPYDSTSFYVCCQNGLYSIDKSYNIATLNKNVWYNYIFKATEDIYIASEVKGLKAVKSNRLYNIEKIIAEFDAYKNFSLNSHVILNDSVVVMGTESFNGLLVWNKAKKVIKNITQENTGNGLASNVVNTVSAYDDSSVIILSDKSLSLVNVYSGKAKNFTVHKNKETEPLGILFDILQKNNFNLIAAYGTGIILTDKEFRVKKIYSTQNGLSNNGVYKIFPASDSTVLVTTNYGINLININSGKITYYTSYNGLHSDIFEEACGIMVNGEIVAGGVKGFTDINLTGIKPNLNAPLLYISKIIMKYPGEISDSSNLFANKFVLKNTILQTSVNFSAINWSSPDRTTFAYRILEQSKEWISLNTQNFITLIGLSPGTYHLQVKAANEDGVWSEPKELILEFLPKWYQTWWFKMLVALTTAGIIYSFYRYRIGQIKKQHEIRKNIATDLHDDLGSTLNSVKVFTNLAISGVKQEESLQQVKDNLTEATMSLRDMIWVLDDSLDTVDELVTRLKQFALPITAASNMEFVINAGSDVNARTLSKEEKRNLFLICKEAINNSIKYSGASVVTVDIIPAGKKVQITVADNGKGFDEATVKKGYGLKNMQYRAGQVKYAVKINSEQTKGVTIVIEPF